MNVNTTRYLGLICLFTSSAIFADVVKPTGEETLGRIFVHAPPVAPSLQVHPYKLMYRGTIVPVGKESERFNGGTGCLLIRTQAPSFNPSDIEQCGIKIEGGKTTHVHLSLLKASYTPPTLPAPAQPDFGPPGELKAPYGTLIMHWLSEG